MCSNKKCDKRSKKCETISLKTLLTQKLVIYSREVSNLVQKRKTGIFRPGLHWQVIETKY